MQSNRGFRGRSIARHQFYRKAALITKGNGSMSTQSVRLTDLAHGGGCGCRLAPSVLQQLLANQIAATPYAQLLVGTETGDDAAVWQIDDKTCIIATTDFFMPVVAVLPDLGGSRGRTGIPASHP